MIHKKNKPEFIISLHWESKEISINSFLTFINKTIDTLDNLSFALSEYEKDTLGLKLRSINLNSPGDIKLTIDDQTSKIFAEKVFNSFIDGSRIIDRERKRPEFFDDDTLDSFHNSIKPLNGEISQLTYVYGRKRTTTTEDIKKNVAYVIKHEEKGAYFSWGTIEGDVIVVSSAEKKRIFKIHDITLTKPVKCYFDVKFLSQVLNAFEKRVSVFGRVKYNKDDVPVSINMEKFDVFPNDDEIPEFDELPVIDITDGIDIEEHMEKLRNGI